MTHEERPGFTEEEEMKAPKGEKVLPNRSARPEAEAENDRTAPLAGSEQRSSRSPNQGEGGMDILNRNLVSE